MRVQVQETNPEGKVHGREIVYVDSVDSLPRVGDVVHVNGRRTGKVQSRHWVYKTSTTTKILDHIVLEVW